MRKGRESCPKDKKKIPVAYNVSWLKTLQPQRRPKMNSANTRTVEKTISMANIIAEIELLLRRFKVVSDDEDIRDFQFGDVVEDGVKIKITAVREGV